MSSLGQALRKVTKTLVEQFGQRVILRTGSDSYDPATGTNTQTHQDRAVRAVVERKRRRTDDGTVLRWTDVTVAAEDLYVVAEFRLPEVGDRVVIGPTDIFGDDDNPGWEGGVEHEVTDVIEEWGPEEVISYRLTVKR